MRNARFPLLCALLWLTRSPAFCQPIEKVCLKVEQAARINDSLRVIPLLRRAVVGYRTAADSLRTADARHRAAYQSEQVATATLGVLLANSETVAANWKAKARKRGLLNALLLAGLSGLGYFTLTH